MKQLCPLCNKYKLRHKSYYIVKCTKCAYEYNSINQYMYIVNYEMINNQKVRKSLEPLCQGSFDYCQKVFKLKVFL